MLAKIQGLFRLTRDLELRYGSSGTPIAKLGLACSEKFKDKESKLFIDGVSFGKQAEILNTHAGTKGTQLFIVGKLHTDEWVDNNNQKRSKISMIIESFDFVGSKQDNQSRQSGYNDNNNDQSLVQNSRQSYQQPHQEQRQMPSSDSVPVIDIDEDEIPF